MFRSRSTNNLRFVQACMAGIVFAKFTKPTNRAETILFSTNALITLRNGSYYLLCRIGDMRWAVGSEEEPSNDDPGFFGINGQKIIYSVANLARPQTQNV